MAPTIERYVRLSLLVTSPLNLLAGYVFAFPGSFLGELLQLPASHPFYTRLTGALIALFGAAYFWMSRQPAIPRALLCVGASGKLIAVFLAWSLFVLDELSGVTAALISGDLVFAGLWLYYLSNHSVDTEGG